MIRPAVLVMLAWGVCGLARAGEPPLQEMPKEGEVPFGETVYVDDRKCPRGQIKEVIGGSREKKIPRTVRCVPRLQRAPGQ